LLLACSLAPVPQQQVFADETPLRVNVNVEVYGFDAAIIPSYKILKSLQAHSADPLAACRRALYASALTYHDAGHNLLVIQGLNHIVDMLIGISAVSIGYCGVGTGSAAAAATDTELDTEVGTRSAITERARGVTGRAHFNTFFEAVADWNGTITETGLFTESATSGTDVCLARRIIDSFVKTSTNAMLIAWTVTFTPG
jgi:hypothetical protein